MKASNLVKALKICFAQKRAAMIWGSPGVGKSAIIAGLAKELGLELLDMRLVMRDTVDMRGVPFVDDNGRTQWAVPAEFPKPGTSGIWFLDEANAAHPQVQVVAYQLTHDRQIGEYKVPDGWVIVLAGNKETDGAVVHKMSSALGSRVIHLELDVDLNDWANWAKSADVHPMIRAFVKFRPNLLHAFDPKLKARTFPCPRTWEIASDIMKAGPDVSVEHDLFIGTVGEGAAIELSGFARSWRSIPDLDDIIANPGTAAVPDAQREIGALYAVAIGLSNRANVVNFGAIVKYLERLPVEFNVMATTDAVKRDGELQLTSAYGKWCHAHTDVMLGQAA